MKKIFLWLLRILAVLIGVCMLTFVIMGLGPVPRDETFAPDDYGAGASSVEPSYTGLQRAFPALNGPTSAEQVELGRMLFFDPVLSIDDDLSCATCHHPDLGFADGLPLAVGHGGLGLGPARSGPNQLARSTPSLWNVGYSRLLFWDGREDSLEAQVEVPITHPDEMGVTDLQALYRELADIPAYASLFEAAYGDSDVTLERISAALAAFQRTMISDDSPFDRYAAGDLGALSPSQRRGLALFRSAATRCFECHAAPTFASDTLRIIGVPGSEDDPGAGHGDFKVPGLRNVALTAPYMHNGAFATLEEVIDFYAQGGGRSRGVENVDPFVLGFDLSEQEKADLVAFLYALTDERALPEIPDQVPSGLLVVPALENAARLQAASYNVTASSQPPAASAPQVIRVQPGERIQDAVDRARPGDTVEIPFGTYHERVVVDISDLTLVGVPNDAGAWPTLDGQGELPEAVISSGNNFEVGYLRVVNYASNGILVEGVSGVHIHHTYVEATGVYGLYPVQSTGVLIEHNQVTGANDAGIYAGQCVDVIVRENEVYGNVLGIEVENTVNAQVYDNFAHDNTLGIFIDLLPQLTSKVSLNTRVYNNLVENNNLANFAQPGTAASIVPAGTGIGILSADQVEVYENVIRGNKTAGLGMFHMNIGFEAERINVPANPENNYIHDNQFENNGYDPDKFVTDLGIPGSDILWDVSGDNNRFDQPGASSFPPALPGSRWPGLAYNAYWRLLNVLLGLLG